MKKHKKISKMILRLIALILLSAGFTLAVIASKPIWSFTIAAALVYGIANLIS